jgi:hypothetical protein
MGLKPRAFSKALLNLCYNIQHKILQIHVSPRSKVKRQNRTVQPHR